VVHRREPQRFFGREVVIDLWLVGVGPSGDRPGGRTIEPLGPELDQRRVEQPLTDVRT
jgi:hypothetical protein